VKSTDDALSDEQPVQPDAGPNAEEPHVSCPSPLARSSSSVSLPFGENMITATKPLHRALEIWRSHGVRVRPPADEASIIATMAGIGRPVSQDVIALYRLTDGFEDWTTDDYLWSLWPLSRIAKAHAEADYTRPYILFSDFCIRSYMYCFRYLSLETSSVSVDYFDGHEPVLVAHSVAEFFEIYCSEPGRVLLYK
jgi:hypothetical protein